MKNLKNELQNLITGNGKESDGNLIKEIQVYLSGNEKSNHSTEEKKHLKSEEEKCLIKFIQKKNLWFSSEISIFQYLGEGAEQKVYRFDDASVIKINDSIFYEYWLDYLNSLLIHNFFFKSTAYELLGFKIIADKLYSVVKQNFIQSTEKVDLEKVKLFLEHNLFTNTRNNDYINEELGLIFEDLHDENVISNKGILFFIDTIFYLTPNFYKN